MKILVVEDEEAIRDLIAINLEMVGYSVIKAEDGLQAKNILKDEKADLILLDIMLPEIDGFSLIKEIKDDEIPVIFVTAKESTVDKVKGLRLGADDYISKPFEAIELIARVEAVLRRYKKYSDNIVFRNIEVSTSQRVVKLKGKEICLTTKEYELLLLFIQNKNIALSREQILNRVWGYEYIGETRTVDMHVQRIRDKLHLRDAIKTIFKVGYRLED